jgi:hypothetical protein
MGRGARVVACATLVGAVGCGASAYGVAVFYDAGTPVLEAGADGAADAPADGVTHGAPPRAPSRNGNERK